MPPSSRTDGTNRDPVGVSRRTLLASVGVAGSGVLAGCVPLGGPGERTTLRLREPDPQGLGVATPETDLRDDQATLVTTAARNGSATAYGYRPFETPEYVRIDGTYYRVRTEEAGTATVRKPVLVVTRADDTSRAVSLDEYDGHVVELVAPLLDETGTGTRVLQPDTTGVDALLPEPRHEYVTWDNATYRVTVEDRQVEQRAWRVRADSVASSAVAFETYLRDQGVGETIAPTDLSQAARDVFREAIAEGYTERAPYSDAFQDALAAIRQGREFNSGEWGGYYLLVYDGALYRAEVEVVSSG